MKIDREKLLRNINDNDQIYNMKKIIDKLDLVLKKGQVSKTNFLNPYETNLAISIINQFHDLSHYEYGGYDNAENYLQLI